MADAKKDAAEGEGAPPKKSKKLLLIIIVAVLVVIIAAVAAVLLLKKPPAEEEGEDEDGPPAKSAKAKKAKGPVAPPAFAKLDPFVVKLQSVDQQEAYVQAIPELKLADALMSEQIKQYMPEIRHKLLLILASKKAAELGTPEGMQMLANQIRESINATLSGEKADPAKEKLDTNEDGPVIAVFFSSLIVQ
jgi:flagellar FliL protein